MGHHVTEKKSTSRQAARFVVFQTTLALQGTTSPQPLSQATLDMTIRAETGECDDTLLQRRLGLRGRSESIWGTVLLVKIKQWPRGFCSGDRHRDHCWRGRRAPCRYRGAPPLAASCGQCRSSHGAGDPLMASPSIDGQIPLENGQMMTDHRTQPHCLRPVTAAVWDRFCTRQSCSTLGLSAATRMAWIGDWLVTDRINL
jgi:hypothetical protein